MIKAIVTNGRIMPQVPIPEDWQEGTEVTVEKLLSGTVAEKDLSRADAWMDEVESIARQGNPADDQRLATAVKEVGRREKELASRKLGRAI